MNGVSSFDFSAAATRRSVERSLRRLRVETLDVVLIHSDGGDLELLEHSAVLPTLRDLQQQGLIRAVGMSSKTVEGGLRAVQCCDVVMATYNLIQQQELPVLEAAAAAGKGVLIKKGLMSGHLAQITSEDPVAAALQLIYAAPAVSSVIVGTVHPQHLRANVAAAEALAAASAGGKTCAAGTSRPADAPLRESRTLRLSLCAHRHRRTADRGASIPKTAPAPTGIHRPTPSA